MVSVSVVIPSCNRHEEVVRAVESALNQTSPCLEVIVSNDGPDPEKARLISSLSDDRVRFVESPRRQSASATRNYGIQCSRGAWIALLDDDDIWLPNKLEAQFEALQRSGFREAILAGPEVVYQNGKRAFVRPKSTVPFGTPVDEVLFCRWGGVNTSTLVAPTWVFKKYQFDESQKQHEDWSWMLHAGQELELIMTDAEICERHLTPGEGLSEPGGYLYSKQWFLQHESLMSPAAKAGYICNSLSRRAAYDRRLCALPWILSELRRISGINAENVFRLLLPWVLPTKIRGFLRRFPRVLKVIGVSASY
jgi:glycosyltransferase involved in cell wall biosynthesis